VRYGKNETVVGMIIFSALVMLFLGLMWLEGHRFRGQGYLLVAHFEDVSGLNQGDPVTIAGLAIGRVHDMRLEGQKVAVSLWIEGKQTLPLGSIAVLKSEGVMGEKYVDILLGTGSEDLESGEAIPGLYQPDFSQMVSLVGGVGQDIRAISSTARSLLGDSAKAELKQSITDIRSTTSLMNNLLIQNAERLDETLANLHALSITLGKISPGQSPEELIPNLEKASQDLAQTAEYLRGFSVSLDSLLQPTLRGEGTLGKLLADESLYVNITGLVASLDSLVQDIRENPGRYVQFKIF
jgi:phospholipid/cholesterol/gamma-HCH transport system substrate-binding protein